MAAFFGRLQKANRLIEGGAPAYLRTHPMSVERMSDMQNRAQNLPAKLLMDSEEFNIVRAKIRVSQGVPRDNVQIAEEQLRDRKFASETAARYFLVEALIRDQNLVDRKSTRLNSSHT